MTHPEVAELTALRRVGDGEVTICAGGYVHGGRPITGELAQALVRLRAAGYLTVGARGPAGHRPVQITAAGAVRAAELGGRHG
ncbi:MAG TPA: hypothetical protein VHH34_15355 [Pseudonocardiaceae bacterium]|nr:hypothetical protein [Pseudonocardiaceae bacterium]